MRITAVVAGISLVAGSVGAQASNTGRPAAAEDGTVSVLLLTPSPETNQPLRYVLSEPAYVAAFAVYPGAGVRLLYPLINQPEQLHSAGYHTDQLIGLQDDNSFFADMGPVMRNGPVYLYVLASRSPLDVTRYVHRPLTLASAAGTEESHSYYGDVAFNALLDNAISLDGESSWDADMLTLWDTVGTRSSYARANGAATIPLKTIVCANGSTRNVPFNYPFVGCPGDRHIRPDNPPTRPPQQTAMTEAPEIQPTHTPGMSSAPRLVASQEAPTVLPTIIGPRVSDSARQADIERAHAALRETAVTVANGAVDGSVDGSQAAAAAALPTQIQVIDVVPIGGRGHGNRVGAAERRAHENERRGRSGHVGGSPGLPPNPRLAPNPQLPPNPGMGPSYPRGPMRATPVTRPAPVSQPAPARANPPR